MIGEESVEDLRNHQKREEWRDQTSLRGECGESGKYERFSKEQAITQIGSHLRC